MGEKWKIQQMQWQHETNERLKAEAFAWMEQTVRKVQRLSPRGLLVFGCMAKNSISDLLIRDDEFIVNDITTDE